MLQREKQVQYQQSMDIPIAFSEQRDKAAICLKLTSLKNDSCLLGISLCKLKMSKQMSEGF